MKTKQQSSAQEWTPSQKVQNLSDFSGRDLFVGIDVHKERWQVAICYEGLVLSNSSIEASAQLLITHLRKRYGEAHYSCVYESGPFGFSLCRSLWAAGMECMVVNPADVPGTDKERRSKTDRVDARKLARHLAAGQLEAIYVPCEQLQKQRSLMRFRKKVWGDLVRSKNRLKSELLFQGILLPKEFATPYWSHNLLQWIEQQAGRDEDLRDTLVLMLEEVRLLRGVLLKTERKLRELMRSQAYKENSELLRSIPGVGPLTAMLFLLEVGDIHRFKSFDALNRLIGFCPDSNSSGEKDIVTGLSVRRHSQLRSMLIEAAWQLIRRDAAMLDAYKELTKRMKGQDAIIRIARKLLRRMRAVLLSGRPYICGIQAPVTKKELNASAPPVAKQSGRERKNAYRRCSAQSLG
jgi:transposase